MTLDGAARCLKQNKGTISRDAELLERLQRVRALLEEVRAELKESAEDRAVVAETGLERRPKYRRFRFVPRRSLPRRSRRTMQEGRERRLKDPCR